MTVLKKVLGAFFLLAGINKIMGYSGTVYYVGEMMGYPYASLLVMAAIVAEVAGGIALLMPRIPALKNLCVLRQQVAAYGLLVFTALATVMFHVPGMAGETFDAEMVHVMKNVVVIAALWAVGRSVTKSA